MRRVTALALTWAAIAIAQDRVTVPLSNPSQPATIKAHIINGSITVTAGTGPQVVVESQDAGGRVRGRGRDRDNIPPGMHRLDTGSGFTVQEDRNTVTINPEMGGVNAHLVIQAPVNTSVELKTITGPIELTGLNGELDVESSNGPVTLNNVSGSVVAHTLNGSVKVTIDRPAPDKPMSFSSLNGRVDVTLPADTKARLRLKTNNGAVYTDFDVKLEPDNSRPVVESGRGQGGAYRIRVDRGVYGSINGGGPEYSFQTLNGTILIHKK
jgi:hypothetical protein